MYKLCRTEKSLSRQRELEEGFLRYMNTVPFSEIEIADLCRHLDIPRKTFYRYFGSKEDALYALVDHRLADLNNYLNSQIQTPDPTVREQAVHYFTFWKHQKQFLDVLVRNYLGSILMVRAIMPINMPAKILYSQAAEKDSPDNYMYNFLSSGILAMVLQWYFSGFQKDIQEMADITQMIYPHS